MEGVQDKIMHVGLPIGEGNILMASDARLFRQNLLQIGPCGPLESQPVVTALVPLRCAGFRSAQPRARNTFSPANRISLATVLRLISACGRGEAPCAPDVSSFNPGP